MPWKEVKPMEERTRFIARLLEGDKMTDLCREYGISRKTGYKFLSRFEKLGPQGLYDLSRRPLSIPHKTQDVLERVIIEFKKLKPTWGPKKIKVRLGQLHPGVEFPAASTMGEILERHGLVKHRNKRRFRERLYPTSMAEAKQCNEIWAVDYKGQFQLQNKRYCYPLTVSDCFSRFLLGCESFEDTKTLGARDAFEAIFEEYGLPDAIRSDNGAPFSSSSLGGLSELSVWWLRLGIRPERIEPGHPEQNGRHERMHRTLKESTTRPPASNHLQQQEKFDEFRSDFNFERPHEALEMKTPGSLYHPSSKSYREANKEPEYPFHDLTRTVMKTGHIKHLKQAEFFIGRALRGQKVGLRDLGQNIWLVTFVKTELGYLDVKTGKLLPDNPLTQTEPM